MTLSPGTSPMKPKTCVVVRFLYLFAGRARWAHLAGCLATRISEFNASAAFAFEVRLETEEVDILRGGKAHDLLDPARRQWFLDSVAAGGYIFYFSLASV